MEYPYSSTAFPAPGSAAMAVELARPDKMAVMNLVDILLIGNEP
jgi:hypothetical protein